MLRAYSPNKGFTLIEVLISVLVVSLGLLGMASLQMKSIQFSRSAHHRSMATVLAHDMSERMRANIQGVQDPNAYYNQLTGAASGSVYACAVQVCDSQDLQQDDYNTWRTGLGELLPSGEGIVCIDDSPYDGSPSGPECSYSGGPSQFVIKVWWDEDGDGEKEMRFVTGVMP